MHNVHNVGTKPFHVIIVVQIHLHSVDVKLSQMRLIQLFALIAVITKVRPACGEHQVQANEEVISNQL